MPHRDERIPKTLEARAISHDPLVPDDTEQDEPMFEAEEVLDADKESQEEKAEHYDPQGERGRDTEADAENSDEPDESANVADANAKPKRKRKAKENSDD